MVLGKVPETVLCLSGGRFGLVCMGGTGEETRMHKESREEISERNVSQKSDTAKFERENKLVMTGKDNL